MSTRRSSRRDGRSLASKRAASIPPSIRAGLESLAEGNAPYITKMLSLDLTKKGDEENSTIEHTITEAVLNCMTMNNLSAEMLLARFFDAAILSSYSMHKLHKSGKGSSSTLAARIVKEWSKPNVQSKHTKRKRSGSDVGDDSLSKDVKKGSKEEDIDDDDDDDDDWRKPLFYWKGTLIHNTSRDQQQEQQQLTWIGLWVSGLAEDGLPTDSEFKATEKTNSFNLSNKGEMRAMNNNGNERNNNTNNSSSATTIESILTDLTGQFKGSYLLDQGMGPAKYKDTSHHFAFNDSWWQCSHDGSSINGNIDSTSASGSTNDRNNLLLMMSASGTTEFGNFVSMGYVQPKAATVEGEKIVNNNTVLFEVVLARRYIDDDDVRQALVVKKKKPQLLFSDSSGHKWDKSAVEKKTFWADILPRKM